MIFCLPQENSLLTNHGKYKQGGDVYQEVRLSGYWPIGTIAVFHSLKASNSKSAIYSPSTLGCRKQSCCPCKQSDRVPAQFLMLVARDASGTGQTRWHLAT